METLTGEHLTKFQDECMKNTKIITSRQIFNASLKDLCMNTIINSLRMSSKVTIDLQRLADLPFALRQELLKKLCVANDGHEEKEDLIKLEVRFMVASLLLEQISEFNFKCLVRSCEEDKLAGESNSYKLEDYFLVSRPYEQKMFTLLVQKCRKNLQCLISFAETWAAFLPCIDFVYPALLENLLKLDNLQRLELSKYAFRKSEFALLGSKLVNLVYLNCNVVDATPASLSEGLKPMRKLQVFIFSVAATNKEKNAFELVNCESLYHMCMKEFPLLKVAGENLNGKLDWDSYFHFNSKNQSFGVDDDTLYGPRSRSQLEHLILGEPTSQGQVEWHSNVTTLYVNISQFENKTQKIEDLRQLKNVKSLILNGPISSHANAEATITRFLQVFGPKLTCLCITATSKEICYRIIPSICPNLTTLTMDRSPPNFGSVLKDMRPFKALTKIFISYFNVSQNPEVLVQLFTATKLEHLQLVGTTFGASSSAKALMDLRMKEEAIAPRLITLKILMPTVGGIEQFTCPQTPGYHHEYFQLLQFVCSKAPLLKEAYILPLGFSMERVDFLKPIFKRSRYNYRAK